MFNSMMQLLSSCFLVLMSSNVDLSSLRLQCLTSLPDTVGSFLMNSSCHTLGAHHVLDVGLVYQQRVSTCMRKGTVHKLLRLYLR